MELTVTSSSFSAAFPAMSWERRKRAKKSSGIHPSTNAGDDKQAQRLAGKSAVGKRLDYLGTVEQLHRQIDGFVG
jgi:hypothetical protein